MDDEESSAQLHLMFRYIQMIDYDRSNRSRQTTALPFLRLGPNWRPQDPTDNPTQRFDCLFHAHELRRLHETVKNGMLPEAMSIEMVELHYGFSVVDACKWSDRSVPGRKRDQLERAFQGKLCTTPASSSLEAVALDEIPEPQWASPTMIMALESPAPPGSLDEPLVHSLLDTCLFACQQVARAHKIGSSNAGAPFGDPESTNLKIGINGWLVSEYYKGRLWGLLRAGKNKGAFADLSPSARPVGAFTATQWAKREFDVARIHRPQVALEVVRLIWEVYRPVSIQLS
jgi:hypothetical protein